MSFARNALVLAFAAGVALLVARHLRVDIGGLWVVLSTVTILKPKFSDAVTTARDQLFGTTVGVCFGAVFGLMHQAVISVAVAVFLTAWVCGVIPMLRTVVSIACVGAAIVIILPAGRPSYVTAWNRFTDTLLGAAIALLVAALAARTYRWWPAKS